MKSVITGPGFYVSGEHKIEIKGADDGLAFGRAPGGYAALWDARTGEQLYGEDDCLCFHITVLWTDKPKPIEAYAAQWHDEDWTFYGSKAEAEEAFAIAGKIRKGCITPRLVHLIEAEEAVGGWPKLKAAEVARRMAAEDRG